MDDGSSRFDDGVVIASPDPSMARKSISCSLAAATTKIPSRAIATRAAPDIFSHLAFVFVSPITTLRLSRIRKN